MSLRLPFALLALVIAASPAHAGPTRDWYQWMYQQLWPSAGAALPTRQMPAEEPVEYLPLPPPAPAPVPPVASPPVSVPPPVAQPTPPAAKPAPRPAAAPSRHKPRAVERTARTRPAMCSQIDMGVRMLGVEGMRQAARSRGYSNSQIAGAQRACGY